MMSSTSWSAGFGSLPNSNVCLPTLRLDTRTDQVVTVRYQQPFEKLPLARLHTHPSGRVAKLSSQLLVAFAEKSLADKQCHGLSSGVQSKPWSGLLRKATLTLATSRAPQCSVHSAVKLSHFEDGFRLCQSRQSAASPEQPPQNCVGVSDHCQQFQRSASVHFTLATAVLLWESSEIKQPQK